MTEYETLLPHYTWAVFWVSITASFSWRKHWFLLLTWRNCRLVVMPGKDIPKPDARLALAQLALALHQVAAYGLGIRKQRGGCAATHG